MTLAVFEGFFSPQFRVDCTGRSLDTGRAHKKLFAIVWTRDNDLYQKGGSDLGREK